MVNQKLIEWINENRAKGYTNQQLVNILEQYGYTETDAKEAVTQSTLNNNPIYQQNPPNNPNNIRPNLSNNSNGINANSLTKSSKSNKRMLLIVSIIIISIIIVGGLFYFIYKNNLHPSTPRSQTSENSSNLMNQNSSKQQSNSASSKLCTNEFCFNESLKSCTSGVVFKANSPVSPVYYKIIGKNGTYCDVLFKYLKVPNPSWVNKTMICEMNGSLGVEKAFQEALTETRCHGELYDLMTHSNGQSLVEMKEIQFNQSLKECKVGASDTIYTPDNDNITLYYKIIGKKGSYCNVLFKYLKAPNPAWINKTMTCSLIGSLGIEKSMTTAFQNGNCSGELVTLIINSSVTASMSNSTQDFNE
ncbi:MAG: hypothetical protein GWP09_00770 [Nitrospiraceae bacterium]|nr:hypothetical protein [Nitrospiraceae bacterium]